MMNLVLILSLVGALILPRGCKGGQSAQPEDELSSAVEQALTERDGGHYVKAAEQLEHLLESVPASSWSAAEIRNRLAMTYQDLGRYRDAENEYRRAVRICRGEGARGQDLLAAILNNLGSLYSQTGRFSLARQRLEEALQIRKAIGGPAAEMFPVWNHLAEVAFELGDLPAASDLFENALAVCRKTSGPASRNTAAILNNLALVRRRQQRLDDAGKLLGEAINLLSGLLGKDHPAVGQVLANLAGLRLEQGRMEEAEAAAQRALAIFEATLSPDHPSIASLLRDYSKLLTKIGRGEEARQMRKRAREIYQENREENFLDHTVDVSAFAPRR
jgi:tetratricopeptide (TPR) repeat protein